jgi:hypothetical protein
MVLGRFMVLGCFSLSCSARQTPSSAAQTDAPLTANGVSRFLPLVDGTIWAYDARDDETGNQGMFVTRARRLPGPRFSLASSQSSHVLEVRADGIARAESSAYILKAPLAPGSEWPGEAGSIVHVAAIDRLVEVPAGKFAGCVETIEELRAASGKDPSRRITTTYCPDVGITLLHAEAWENGHHAGERATLRSFGKPVELK